MPSKTAQSRKKKKTVYIVGFAPSWEATPWGEPDAEYWGLNALYKMAADKTWDRWFQLHDIDKHHTEEETPEQISWLRGFNGSVYMWPEHAEKYELPNVIPYPREGITEAFGTYFTNSISWMIAMAIDEGFEKVGVYGVDMAQDSEYGHQRPSCEFFLGWAAGKGIDIDIPDTSDLLKTPFLYGVEDGGPMRKKFEARFKELSDRKTQVDQQINALQFQSANLAGAIEDTKYYIRAWSQSLVAGDGQVEPQALPQEATP